MALALYRRHRSECKGRHPHNLRTSEYDERKKGWKRCECPIFASGTLNKKFKRYNTGQWEFEAARAVALTLERNGRWDKVAPALKVAPTSEPAASRITVEDALQAFIAKCKEPEYAPNTLAKYKTFTNQLQAYADGRGI